MSKLNQPNGILIIFVALLVGLHCESGDRQAEANKIVGEANVKLIEARELMAKIKKRHETLFSAGVKTVQELAEYKKEQSVEAEAIVDDYEKISAMLKEISVMFDEVSRMNVRETYKEYAKLKSDEYAKRAEAVGIRKGNAQAFIEIDDQQLMTKKFDENNTKSDKIFTEADELEAKAKRLEEENQGFIYKIK